MLTQLNITGLRQGRLFDEAEMTERAGMGPEMEASVRSNTMVARWRAAILAALVAGRGIKLGQRVERRG